MEDIIRNTELLSAVKWYFELKNLSLRNALLLRCPLSVEEQKDLRLYYSQYFSGLLSATELLLENSYPNHSDFKVALYQGLRFEGFSDGENNYSYLRELRNSIIHRGLDVSSSAHINDNFPMIIAPSPVTNRSGKISYAAFGHYLIEVVDKCESVIGKVFLAHFEEHGLFQIRMPQEKAVELSKKFISEAYEIPDWVKNMALGAVETINHEEIHEASINSLKEALNDNVLSRHIA